MAAIRKKLVIVGDGACGNKQLERKNKTILLNDFR
jgi:hypothetical protein